MNGENASYKRGLTIPILVEQDHGLGTLLHYECKEGKVQTTNLTSCNCSNCPFQNFGTTSHFLKK